MSEQVWTQCPVCEGPMENWESTVGKAVWYPIETRPEEGEFLAYDPVSRKQDVCHATTTDVYGYLDVSASGKPYSSRKGKIGSRRSCSQVQYDGTYGPNEDEFQGDRATHWMTLSENPS